MEKTIAELSQETGIPDTTLRDAAQDGRLPARKSGDTWLINTDNPAYGDYLKRRAKWLKERGRAERTRDIKD